MILDRGLRHVRHRQVIGFIQVGQNSDDPRQGTKTNAGGGEVEPGVLRQNSDDPRQGTKTVASIAFASSTRSAGQNSDDPRQGTKTLWRSARCPRGMDWAEQR